MDQRLCRLIVRPFELADAEAVVVMMRDLAILHDDVASVTATDIARYTSGRDQISTVIVALLDDIVSGFSATYDWMNYIQGFPVRNIDLLFVRESARGRGVGRALLSAIARDAKRSGCQRMTVGAEPDNEGANAFYRRMAFDLRHPAANRYAISGCALDQLAVLQPE